MLHVQLSLTKRLWVLQPKLICMSSAQHAKAQLQPTGVSDACETADKKGPTLLQPVIRHQLHAPATKKHTVLCCSPTMYHASISIPLPPPFINLCQLLEVALDQLTECKRQHKVPLRHAAAAGYSRANVCNTP